MLLKAAVRCGLVSAFDTAASYLELLLSQPELEQPENREFLIRTYMEYHTVLCNLVKVSECDRIYRLLCDMVKHPAELVDSCCMQISSPCNRGEYEEAFRIGLSLLEQMGVSFPHQDFESTMERKLHCFIRNRKPLETGDPEPG